MENLQAFLTVDTVHLNTGSTHQIITSCPLPALTSHCILQTEPKTNTSQRHSRPRRRLARAPFAISPLPHPRLPPGSCALSCRPPLLALALSLLSSSANSSFLEFLRVRVPPTPSMNSADFPSTMATTVPVPIPSPTMNLRCSPWRTGDYDG